MSNKDGFLINGEYYAVPEFGSMTVDECEVFTEKTGGLVAEIVSMDLADGSIKFLDLLKNNGFLPALAMIAYRRKHPDLGNEEIEAVIGGTKRFDLFAGLLDSGEQEPDPPSADTTRPPPEQSQNGSSESSPLIEPVANSSGASSTPSSVTPDVERESTGTIGSGMSRTSGPERLGI